MGRETDATGPRPDAMGRETDAAGPRPDTVGSETEAAGPRPDAVGSETEAAGPRPDAVGSETEATGARRGAMGRETEATGARGSAMGRELDTTVDSPTPTRIERPTARRGSAAGSRTKLSARVGRGLRRHSEGGAQGEHGLHVVLRAVDGHLSVGLTN
jgi:hypothetical protein